MKTIQFDKQKFIDTFGVFYCIVDRPIFFSKLNYESDHDAILIKDFLTGSSKKYFTYKILETLGIPSKREGENVFSSIFSIKLFLLNELKNFLNIHIAYLNEKEKISDFTLLQTEINKLNIENFETLVSFEIDFCNFETEKLNIPIEAIDYFKNKSNVGEIYSINNGKLSFVFDAINYNNLSQCLELYFTVFSLSKGVSDLDFFIDYDLSSQQIVKTEYPNFHLNYEDYIANLDKSIQKIDSEIEQLALKREELEKLKLDK